MKKHMPHIIIISFIALLFLIVSGYGLYNYAYQKGYNNGYSQGNHSRYTDGHNQGVRDGFKLGRE